MFPNPFNKDLDKITEREVVFDFVERLRLGKNFYIGFQSVAKKLYTAKTKLLDLFKPLYMALPSFMLDNLNNIEVTYININKGENVCHATIKVDGKYKILNVRDQTTQFDVTPCFNINNSEDGTSIIITAKFDAAYPYNNIFTVYLKKY